MKGGEQLVSVELKLLGACNLTKGAGSLKRRGENPCWTTSGAAETRKAAAGLLRARSFQNSLFSLKAL